MRSGEEIRRDLVRFAARWQGYAGSERAEAQTFLNELFACYGRDRRDSGALFEDSHSTTGIMDCHLPGVVIIEMKAPKEGERLDQHRPQARPKPDGCQPRCSQGGAEEGARTREVVFTAGAAAWTNTGCRARAARRRTAPPAPGRA